MHQPYIGITDFTRREQSMHMLNVLRDVKASDGRRLAIGVMMSWKTLYGMPTKWSKAFPKNEEIADIFLPDHDVYNVLHYADYDGNPPLSEHLNYALTWCGPHIHAIQLDMVWPDADSVRLFRRQHPQVGIILQVGEKAFDQVENDPQKMIERLRAYGGTIDYTLLDKSMGRGLGMNADALLPFARAIEAYVLEGHDIATAAAGGLGPDTFQLVAPLAHEFPGISIDAQSKLRPSGNARDPIDWNMAELYLRRALAYLDRNTFNRR